MSIMPLPLTKLREIKLKKRETTISLLKRRFVVDFLTWFGYLVKELLLAQLLPSISFFQSWRNWNLLIQAQAVSFPLGTCRILFTIFQGWVFWICVAAAPLRFSFYISHKVSIKHSNFVDLLFPLVPFSSLFCFAPFLQLLSWQIGRAKRVQRCK